LSISDTVRLYLKMKPYMHEALRKRVVNFSALARLIQKDLSIRSQNAVKIALIRYAESLRKSEWDTEEKALSVLEENQITLLEGVRVIIADKKLNIENSAEVKTDSYYIYLTRKDAVRGMGKQQRDQLIKVNNNCSAITVYSGENLEKVSGVVAFMASVLAEEDINVIELISCYTETIFVVNKYDALRAYQLLSNLTLPGH